MTSLLRHVDKTGMGEQNSRRAVGRHKNRKRAKTMAKQKATESSAAHSAAKTTGGTGGRGAATSGLHFRDLASPAIPFTPDPARVAALQVHARSLNAALPKRERTIPFGGISG